jgi:hypothetical protein
MHMWNLSEPAIKALIELPETGMEFQLVEGFGRDPEKRFSYYRAVEQRSGTDYILRTRAALLQAIEFQNLCVADISYTSCRFSRTEGCIA